MKKVVILGSTGSIGENALNIIRDYPGRFKLKAIAFNSNIKKAQKQINEFKPEKVCVFDKNACKKIKKEKGVKYLSGLEGLIELSDVKKTDYDIILISVVGAVGVYPSYYASLSGKTLCLANKEALVAAGNLITANLKKSRTKLIPVDSEHNAVFQCLKGEKKSAVEKIILTASGGPFFKRKTLKNITPQMALKHPTWNMGKKITVDSATLVNKGLEVIEAHHLFGVPPEKINVVIHPQSIIHSLVEFIDGSIIAQLGVTDMINPLWYAFNYPLRARNNFKKLKLTGLKELTFLKADSEKFKGLALAYDALKEGGCAPCVFNAANEKAVEAFLSNKISFIQIARVIEETLLRREKIKPRGLNEIMLADKNARVLAEKIITRYK